MDNWDGSFSILAVELQSELWCSWVNASIQLLEVANGWRHGSKATLQESELAVAKPANDRGKLRIRLWRVDQHLFSSDVACEAERLILRFTVV
jgi:hypothetical protein